MTLLRSLEEQKRQLLMDRSAAGRVGTTFVPLDVPKTKLPDENLLRDQLEMPEVSESEIVRYFSQLSQFNFSIDHNFYMHLYGENIFSLDDLNHLLLDL